MASLPQVGLEATIAGMGAFQSAANSIQSTYNQLDKAASNVAKSTTSSFVSLGNGVIGFAQTAATVGVAGIAALTAGIVGLGVVAVGEFAKYERMSLSITNLVAREISQGQMVEQQIQTRISLTKKENEELSALPQKIKDEELSRNTLAAQIQEQKQRIIDLTAAYGDNGLNVQTAKSRLAEMENEYSKSGQEIDKLNGRIAELNNKNGQLTTTLQKVRTGQMSMTDAMAQAGPRAAELLKWIQILAIQSPFTQEGVANAFRTALAYGFTTEQAQRITSAMIDFTSATGKSEESANLIALALGQIQARGKLSAQELRQLSEQGVGVNKILEDMGFSLDDVTAGLVPVDKFIEATIKDMEVFKGAAKSQSTTFAGLIASLSDLKSIGLREFFTGTFNAIQPYAASFVEWLTNAALQTGSIKKMGESLGQYVGKALKTITDLVGQFQRWGPEGIFAAMGFKSSSLFFAQLSALWAMITEQGPSAESIFTSIGATVNYLQANTFPMLTKAISFVMQNFDSFKGALLGIGAVLGAGVFAAIVAGLLSLLTPINLIIAGAALLGAAWMGNWFGIRDTILAVWISIQPILVQIGQYMNQLVASFQTGGIGAVFAKIQTDITAALPGIMTSLNTLATSIIAWASSPELQQSISTFGQNLGLMIANGISTGVQSSGGVTSILLGLGSALLNVVTAIGVTLITVGSQLVAGILAGILNSMGANLQPTTLSELGAVLTGIGNNIVTIARFIGTQIVTGIKNGWNSAISSVSEVFNQGVESWTKIITGANWFDIGKAIIEGLAQGIKKNVDTVLEVMKTLAKDALKSAMSALGIGSPSKEFAKIGTEIVQGLMTGVDTTTPAFNKSLSKSLQSAISLSANLVKQDVAGRQRVRNLFTNWVSQNQDKLANLTGDQLKSYIGQYANAWGSNAKFVIDKMIEQGYDFNQLAKKLKDTYSDFMLALRLENIRSSLSTANQFASFEQGVIDRMSSQIEILQDLVNAGGGEYLGVVYSEVEAQNLLNKALADQLSVQEQITALKQQQSDLQFLQQQVDLIKLIQDKGLNVSDIFSGITFGLNASLPDLITATSRVVQAMVDQINTDLQIGSPSKVMVGIGKVIDSSLGQGLIDNISAPLSAARKMVEGVVNVASGQLTGTGQSVSNVVNNNFNMTVSALSSPQAVMQQYQVMRAMV